MLQLWGHLNGEDKNLKTPQYNVVQHNTIFNYDLINTFIFEFTHFGQSHQKLNLYKLCKS